MRTERTMNAVAVAVEREIVCSFIFKNRWARNSLDKICGQHSSQVSRIGVRIAKKGGGGRQVSIWKSRELAEVIPKA